MAGVEDLVTTAWLESDMGIFEVEKAEVSDQRGVGAGEKRHLMYLTARRFHKGYESIG